MRGDLFDVDRPSAASVAPLASCEAARHTTRSQTGSMDRRKYSFYTLRAGTPHQAGARHHCGQRPLICLATIGPRRRRLGSQTTLTNPFPGSQRPVSGLPALGWTLGIPPPAPESSDARKSLISTGLCESRELSTSKQHTLQRRKYVQTAHPRPFKYVQTAHPNK